MSDTNRPVVDTNSFRIENRDGVKTAVFMAVNGEEVLFQRDPKNGQIIQLTKLRLETFSGNAARQIARDNIPNPVLMKAGQRTVKVVTLTASSCVRKDSPLNNRPSWLREGAAVSHDLSLRTYMDD